MDWSIALLILWGIAGMCTLIIGDISRSSYALVWMNLMLFMFLDTL